MLLTFVLCTIGWLLFRAPSIGDALSFISTIFHKGTSLNDLTLGWFTITAIIVASVVEWLNRSREHGLDMRHVRSPWLRALIYYTLIIAILLFTTPSENFIYFQF